ncbi:MAG TPA: DUF3108 domain-containing protein [Thermoanaerobaculia bacterium]|nr:DUF3108 domain-containing protein [Thermoanaerobaculia bacterium]
MTIIRTIVAGALSLAVSASAFANESEQFRYSWRLRGGVRLLAGLMFPTSGVANLQTTFGDTIHSELLITAPNGKQGGFYSYESDMDERGAKTLVTFHGYSWGKKARNERTVFDHQKGLARIHKQTPEESAYRVKKLPASNDEVRDILTAIVFLRQNADSISRPITTTIYSDGKEYPVVFKPGIAKVFSVEGKNTFARAFHIVDAPGGKKWPGGVTVWLTNDDRRIPVRIEIQQSMASLQLDLQKIEASTLMAKL